MSDQKTLTEWPPVCPPFEIPEHYNCWCQIVIPAEWAPGDPDVLPDIEPMALPTPVDDDGEGGYLVPPEIAEALQAWIARGAPSVRFTLVLGQCTPGRRNLTLEDLDD